MGAVGQVRAREDRVAILRTFTPFSSLEPEILGELVEDSRLRSFRRDQLLVTPGARSDHVQLILIGLAWIGVWTPRGHCVPFRFGGPGSLIGALGLLDEQSSGEQARALTDGTVAVLASSMVRDVAGRSAPFALALARLAAELAREARHLLEESRCLDVPGRLARRLLALADASGEAAVESYRRVRLIDLPVRHRDLADLVGASRETVSKALARFSSAGAIRCQQGRIVLLDESRLRRIAELHGEVEGDMANYG